MFPPPLGSDTETCHQCDQWRLILERVQNLGLRNQRDDVKTDMIIVLILMVLQRKLMLVSIPTSPVPDVTRYAHCPLVTAWSQLHTCVTQPAEPET